MVRDLPKDRPPRAGRSTGSGLPVRRVSDCPELAEGQARDARIGDSRIGSKLHGLPGAELVRAGLADLSAGRETVAALALVAAGARLRRLGLEVPKLFADAELRLYRELCKADAAGAYCRYNALLRQIASLARALEREEGKALRAACRRA